MVTLMSCAWTSSVSYYREFNVHNVQLLDHRFTYARHPPPNIYVVRLIGSKAKPGKAHGCAGS